MFEFDYFGEYPDFDVVLINAKIKFYEKGLLILAGLSGKSLFIEWHCIRGVTLTKNKKALINIITDKGIIKLKKEKTETNIGEFKKILKSVAKDIKIEYVKSEQDNLYSLESKRMEKLYEEQEHRVNDFIYNCGSEDDVEIEETWCKLLEEKLQFPFEAEVVDELDYLEEGDIVKVIGIEGIFDLYGIVVKARIGRKQYSIPLSLLEPIEKDSNNHQLIDDYSFWFCNR